jgi:ubiquinone/menaquinone biosynthesis C-methylase UbiE
VIAGRVKAAFYDWLSAASERAGFAERRRRVLEPARGRVLEIGAGTGANLAHYPDSVGELVLLEPDAGLAHRLRAKLAASGRSAAIVGGTAEALPFEDDSFDTVVTVLVLCSVTDPERALSEIRRVVKPDGQLLFAEHVRSDDPRLARWQDRLNRPWWGLVADGCNCNRPTLSTLEAASFEVDGLERGEIPKALPLVRPLIAGRATYR